MRTLTAPRAAARCCGLLALALAASCTRDNPTAPETSGVQPRLVIGAKLVLLGTLAWGVWRILRAEVGK